MIGFLNLLTLIITKHIIYMKKILIIITSIIVAILIIVFTVIKNEKQVTSNAPIVIGAALALTGDASAWGEMSLNSWAEHSIICRRYAKYVTRRFVLCF